MCVITEDLFLPISYAMKSAEKHLAPLLSDVSLWVFPPKTSTVPLSSTAEWRYRAKPLSPRINLCTQRERERERERVQLRKVRYISKVLICQSCVCVCVCVCVCETCVSMVPCYWWHLSGCVTWPVVTALHTNCSSMGAAHTHMQTYRNTQHRRCRRSQSAVCDLFEVKGHILETNCGGYLWLLQLLQKLWLSTRVFDVR